MQRLTVDKWILSSAIQKLIRRGQPKRAIKAALALHAVDPEYLPRRLPIVAFEDIGIGDLTICLDVLRIFRKRRSGPKEGDRQHRRILADIVGRMARATKSRAGCDILCLANANKEHSATAATFAQTSEAVLIALASDRATALASRALALHLLSGMTVHEGRCPRTLSRFNEKALRVVANRLDLPEEIARAVLEGRLTAGLAAMLPLVFEAAQTGEMRVQVSKLTRPRYILGLPAYAVDMYTRVGRHAIAEFSQVIRQEHSRVLERVGDARRLARLVGMAIFHLEGSKLDRRIENKTLTVYREQIEKVELQTLGWPEPESPEPLYDVLRIEDQLLWKIRRTHMLAAFDGNRSDG